MQLERLQLEFEGPVARIWMNRPELRNAFDGLMVTELRKTLFDLRSVDTVRVIVRRGRPAVDEGLLRLHPGREPARGAGPGRPLLHRLRVAQARGGAHPRRRP